MNKIQVLRNKFKKYSIDGYVVPKNDDYFTEYSKTNRLKIISNFTGSAGIAIILKNKNYLFTDGRYTIQSQIESGKNFQIVKDIFEQADDILKFKLSEIILRGSDEELKKTEITQPAILTTSFAIFTVLKSEFNFNLSNKISYTLFNPLTNMFVQNLKNQPNLMKFAKELLLDIFSRN